jgi:hypothetical protein
MIMIYRSHDGIDFSTPEACLKHEAEDLQFEMFDATGERTAQPDNCCLLHLISPNGGRYFSKLCTKEDVDDSGISDFSTPGWYWLSDWEDGFCEISPQMVGALQKANPELKM